jgi:hypothetical protein
MADCVYAPIDNVKAPPGDAQIDLIRRNARESELPSGYDPVLHCSQRRDGGVHTT